MTMEKIAVSLPAELVAQARLAVALGQASSVSAYVAESMSRRSRVGTLGELLDEWDAELGPPSAEDHAWAAEQLGLPADAASPRRARRSS